MKKSLYLGLIVVSGLVFSACIGNQPAQNNFANQSGGSVPQAEEKAGETTKTGQITEAGGSYFLQEAGQPPRQIESYAVDLSAYVGQTVTVTGQYSGDTLFVGSIQ